MLCGRLEIDLVYASVDLVTHFVPHHLFALLVDGVYAENGTAIGWKETNDRPRTVQPVLTASSGIPDVVADFRVLTESAVLL